MLNAFSQKTTGWQSKWLTQWQSNGIMPSAPELLYYQHKPWFIKAQTTRKQAQQTGVQFSKVRGRGLEFDEVRLYQAGDDIRSIDWRVTARTGRTHTKLFHEDREYPNYLCLDLRKPMHFGSQLLFKSVGAAHAAAAIGWGLTHQGEAIAGLYFNDSEFYQTPLQMRDQAILSWIQATQQFFQKPSLANTTRSFNQMLTWLPKYIAQGACLFIVSDFHDLTEESRGALQALQSCCQVIAVQVTDPFEQQLPREKASLKVFTGQTTIDLPLSSQRFQKAYQQQAKQQQQTIESIFNRLAIAHYKVCAARPLEQQIHAQTNEVQSWS